MLGIGNEGIRRNLEWLVDSGANVIVRMPLIRGYNDSFDAITGAIDYVHRSWRSVEISAASTCCRTTSWDAKVRTPGYALPDYQDPSYSPDELDRLGNLLPAI